MDKENLIKITGDFIEQSQDNYISMDIGIPKDILGIQIFDPPIFGFASTEDDYFTLLKESLIIGEHFLLPKEWLSQSKTVISFFLPFTEEIKKGNRQDRVWPSEEWLYGRIEGQDLINKLCMYLKSELIDIGYDSIVPALDERLLVNFNTDSRKSFTSNWSERHIAFIAGLGTFSLSKGLITKRGVAGRFGSIVTELYLRPSQREYKDIKEYCSMCGKCAENCPVNAITIGNGKDHTLCFRFLGKTKEKYKIRYGCGKCQVNVPCESQIPK